MSSTTVSTPPDALASRVQRLHGAWSAAREFFSYHGIWAPGVRAMRNLSMARKALVLVSACFLPIGGLLALWLPDQLAQVTGIERRLDGLRYIAAANETWLSWNTELLALRRGAAVQVDSVGRRQAVERMDRAAEALDGPELTGRLAAFKRSLAFAESVQGDSAADRATRIERIEGLMTALLATRDAATEVSELLLESDADLQQLTHLVVADLPTGQLGVLALRDAVVALQEELARATPDPRRADELRHVALRQLAVLEERARQVIENEAVADVDQALFEAAKDSLRRLVQAAELSLQDGLQAGETVQLDTLVDHLMSAGMLLTSQAMSHAEERLAQRLVSVQRRQWQSLGLLLMSLAFGAYLLASFLRVMSGGVDALRQQALRLAEGDLSHRPMPRGRDEVATAMWGLSQSLNKMADLMSSVRQSVAAMTHATQEIARGNGALTDRNDRSADGITQILQGITGYTTELERTATLVSDAAQAVDALRMDAMRTHKHMDRLRVRVQDLQVKGREISDVVSLIDGIAFRTNILALNASIEASKAGDAGKGFAVVAQEVRALALRSAESARRIHDIVGGSAEDIAQAYALATTADEALTATYANVEQIHSVMSGVVSMTHGGQQTMAGLVEEARQIDRGTRGNQELASQLAEASDGLRQQGERLARKVGTFRLH